MIIHVIMLTHMGVGGIMVGVLTLSNVSKIDTDRIKPLMDAITANGIQPLSAVKLLSILCAIVGVSMFVLILPAGIMILCAAGRIRKCGLVMHISVILMLVIGEVAILAQLANTIDTVENEIKSKMILALNYFKADATTNSNSISNAWNFLFMTLNCCGVNDVALTTNDFDKTPWCTTYGSCQATISQIPKTCCLSVDENTYTSAPTECYASVNSGTYNRKGCYDALKETLLVYSSRVIALIVATLFLEITASVIGLIFLLRNSSPNREISPRDYIND